MKGKNCCRLIKILLVSMFAFFMMLPFMPKAKASTYAYDQFFALSSVKMIDKIVVNGSGGIKKITEVLENSPTSVSNSTSSYFTLPYTMDKADFPRNITSVEIQSDTAPSISSVQFYYQNSLIATVSTSSSTNPYSDYTNPVPEVTGLTISAGTSTNATFSFTTPNYNHFSKYNIYSAGNLVFTSTGAQPNTTYTYSTAITPGTSYTYNVTTVDTLGVESSGAAVTISPPSVPTGLSATEGDGQITLSWSQNTDTPKEYEIYKNGTYLNSVQYPATSFVVTGLENGTNYDFEITAKNSNGFESAKSQAVSAIPQPYIPNVPTGLTATAGAGSITLSWLQNNDNPKEYEIYENGTYLNSVQYPGTSFVVTGLSYGTSYIFQITAKGETGGESAKSAAVTETPKQLVLPSPGTGVIYNGNLGFNPADIFTNSVTVFGFLAMFILLSLVMSNMPKIIDLVRNSFK